MKLHTITEHEKFPIWNSNLKDRHGITAVCTPGVVQGVYIIHLFNEQGDTLLQLYFAKDTVTVYCDSTPVTVYIPVHLFDDCTDDDFLFTLFSQIITDVEDKLNNVSSKLHDIHYQAVNHTVTHYSVS
jgi:hypothetical protein